MEDVKFESKIAALGVSPEGAKWLQQALYPPGQVTKTAITDGGYHPTLRIDSRPSVVVTAPEGPGLDSPTWDLLVLTTPGDVNAARYVAVRSSAVDFEAPLRGVSGALLASTRVGTLSVLPSGIGAARQTAGMTGLLRPNEDNVLTRVQKTVNTSLNPLDPVAFRSTYRSLTAHMTASDLYNGGTVTSAQFDAGLAPEEALTTSAPANLVGPLWRRYSAFLPLSEERMTRAVPLTRVDEAKHGVYVPTRMLGPTQPFRHCEMSAGCPTVGSWDDTAPMDVEVGFVDFLAMGGAFIHGALVVPRESGYSHYDLPWWYSLFLTSGAHEFGTLDTGFDNVACSVTIFRGLAPQATITLTAYVGLQVVVRDTSPFAPLVENSPPEDQRAVEAYYRLTQTMRGSYAAKYNSLGLVVGALGNLLRTYGPTIARTLVSTVAPVVLSHAQRALEPKPNQPFKPAAKPKPALKPAPRRKVRARSASTARSRTSSRRVRLRLK